ncbi:hypothetical protein [Aliarcobacter butzleri]|uniref:hypothetical protein n=1 Tax=Aliarcobacter butzleri TaxID=28197 RepID=UPI0012699774|nr:hypothetical protein [Aliarcobacter butzleri]
MSLIQIQEFMFDWDEAQANYFTLDRISGEHCNCGSNKGEFVLFPIDSKVNKEGGGKLYMKCRVCNGCSHL